MASLAAEFLPAAAIALAQSHRVIVFEQRRFRGPRIDRGFQNGDGVIQRRAGTEIGLGLAWLESANVSLMAIHADVVREPGWKFGRVYDRAIDGAGNRLSRQPFVHVQFARTMTVLAADGHLDDGRIVVESVFFPALHRLGPAGVAANAIGGDGKAEAEVVHFIVGREVPGFFGGVVGNRRLKQIIAPADNRASRRSRRFRPRRRVPRCAGRVSLPCRHPGHIRSGKPSHRGRKPDSGGPASG